jgi:hypothetical protein
VRQEILDQTPDAELRVYAVWMPMLPGDARSEWDGSIFDDPRAINLWDGAGMLGSWLGRRGGPTGASFDSVVWDAFFVFGGDSTWQGEPTGLLAYGSPVIGETGKLGSAVAQALDAAAG